MLKVLIADDDFWVLEGLKSTIDWNGLGFQLMGCAEDADKAYDLYQQHTPDIVITDIRMKHTNGLDLIERIHLENPDTEFVILSGYSQFDYAKRAYENGSAAYLLKPIDNNELISVLLDIAEKHSKKHHLDQRLTLLDSELPGIKASFYNHLIYNETISDIEQKAEVYNIDLFTPYVVISTELSKMAITDLELSNNIHDDILESFELFSKSYPQLSDYWVFSKLNVIAIIRSNGNLPTKAQLEPLQKIFYERTKKYLTIGVSTEYDSISNLGDAYLEASNALSFKSLYGNNAIIFYQDVLSKKATPIFIDNATINELIQAILEIDFSWVLQISDSIFSKIQQHEHVEITNLQNSFAEIISMIVRSIYKDKQSMTAAFSENFHPFTEISDCGTITEIQTYFNNFLGKVFENPNLYMDCSYNPLVQQIIAYIIDNYNQPLTVEDVAREHHLSASYFMQIFKQETGKTFHAYLTEYRMKIAAQLLKNPNYKIYEVSNMVGYGNPEQFAKIFKSIMGQTPTKFRNL